MVDHVAQFGSPDLTPQALEKLIGPTCRLIHDINLREAHAAWILAVAIAHALLLDMLV